MSTRRSTPRAGKRSSSWWLALLWRVRNGMAHTNTPNILAINHRLLDTRDQYLSSSFWAPSTLSTISSLSASQLNARIGEHGGFHTCWHRFSGSFQTVRWPWQPAAQNCNLSQLSACCTLEHCCLFLHRSQFIDSGLDGLDGLPSLLDISVLTFLQQLQLQLLVAHGIQGN